MTQDTKLFTRNDIFTMRARYDAGETPREIWRAYPHASLLAVTRVARRETFREIGVGRTERSLVASRLVGQSDAPRFDFSVRERAEREVAALPPLSEDELAPDMLERAVASLARVVVPAVHPVDMFLAARRPRNPLEDEGDGTPSHEDKAAAEALARHTQAVRTGRVLEDELRDEPT